MSIALPRVTSASEISTGTQSVEVYADYGIQKIRVPSLVIQFMKMILSMQRTIAVFVSGYVVLESTFFARHSLNILHKICHCHAANTVTKLI